MRPILLGFGLVPLCIMMIVLYIVTIAVGEDADTLISAAPGGYRVLAPDSMISFPFELFQGDICFRGKINNRDVRLLLDDGFMWDPLLLWGSPRVDSLDLTYDGEVDIGGSDDVHAIASRTASRITLSFPGVEFHDQTAVVTPYSSGVSNMWSGSEGQVSCTFFKHFVVDINFDKMRITLIEPKKFIYRGHGAEIPWKPLGFGPWSIPATLDLADGRQVTLELMMDLGYNDQLQIAGNGEHRIPTPSRRIPESLGFNIQGRETRGFAGRIEQVTIGGYEIKDVLAGFIIPEHSDHAFHEVMIGLGLLSRFNLVFDYSRQRLFVEPNHTFAEPFEYDMSGVTLGPGDSTCLEVKALIPDSPADDAGLRAGDKITAINGRPAATYTLWERMPLMRREGKTVTLSVQREGRTREVTLTLRRLL